MVRRVLMVLAWLLPVAVLAVFGVDVWTARQLDRSAMEANKNRAIELLGERTQPFELAPPSPQADARVWLFGASSFAAPSRTIVPAELTERFEARDLSLVVDNLAFEGFTSANVLTRVDQALERAASEGVQPDLAVIYSGHNDVTTTYHAAMGFPAAKPDAYPGAALVAWPMWVITGASAQFPDGDGFRFFRNRRMAPLFRLYQQLGLVHFDPETFQPLLDHIMDTYPPNIRAMVDRLRAADIDVMVVTPVGALAIRPTGPNQVTDRLFAEGEAAEDYDTRMDRWLAARDSEVFTSDMRTKSPMIDMLRSLGPDATEGPAPVTVCDVERMFLADRRPMDTTMFIDPLHFSPEGFDMLSDALTTCLLQGPLRGLVAPAPPPEDTPDPARSDDGAAPGDGSGAAAPREQARE